MITLFKPKQSVSEVIQEIHETFLTEVDRLLVEAKISKSTSTDLQPLIDKAKSLRSLGFSNSKECKEAESEITRLEEVKKENSAKSNLIEVINYFSQKYPQYKFITEESVVKICNKYGLVYGEVSRYLGTVPTKNIEDMKSFIIQEEDAIYEERFTYTSAITRIISYSTFQEIKKFAEIQRNRVGNNSYCGSPDFSISKSSFEIAAPIKDFNMEGYEQKGVKISKIEIPDPVVLCPVMYKEIKYYLVVTAWGDEASDELIVNQKMN